MIYIHIKPPTLAHHYDSHQLNNYTDHFCLHSLRNIITYRNEECSVCMASQFKKGPPPHKLFASQKIPMQAQTKAKPSAARPRYWGLEC